MKTDLQLLQLAAKAAGVIVPPLNAYPWHGIDDGGIWTNTSAIGHLEPKKRKYTWAPLTDDGAALRLAVKLKIDVMHYDDHVVGWFDGGYIGTGRIPYKGDPCAATRRAIVCAAAEIGTDVAKAAGPFLAASVHRAPKNALS